MDRSNPGPDYRYSSAHALVHTAFWAAAGCIFNRSGHINKNKGREGKREEEGRKGRRKGQGRKRKGEGRKVMTRQEIYM